MVMVYLYGKMEDNMKENSRMTSLGEKDFLFGQMVSCIMANGKMVNSMEKEVK